MLLYIWRRRIEPKADVIGTHRMPENLFWEAFVPTRLGVVLCVLAQVAFRKYIHVYLFVVGRGDVLRLRKLFGVFPGGDFRGPG